ncbi:hypothetical protein DPMN_105979 [Dreissena polymorpha]|uniref:Uncharacterized protein n=1 Tax=Dreissena polymorpha TaxID=45954 RepID=A0A9D4K455_DREPO|nr:hypothetical protein DPMN_105979 [Dreissena polymorpha]
MQIWDLLSPCRDADLGPLKTPHRDADLGPPTALAGMQIRDLLKPLQGFRSWTS